MLDKAFLSLLRQVLLRSLKRYFAHDVGQQAAALAYYLLFSLFPFLILLSSILGLLQLDISSILNTLEPVLPPEVLELIKMYLFHVAEAFHPAMLWFGVVFSLWFPMRAVRCLMRAVRRAYHLGKPGRPLRYMAKILVYTVLLLVTMMATLTLMTAGRRVLAMMSAALSIRLPLGFVEVWSILRFAVLAVLVFAAVGGLYAMAQDIRQPGRAIVPGAVFALSLWMALSAAYSVYVENFSNYSAIYGALGTVIVLLIWLYLTAIVLVMGAEVNAILLTVGQEKLPRFQRREDMSVRDGEQRSGCSGWRKKL